MNIFSLISQAQADSNPPFSVNFVTSWGNCSNQIKEENVQEKIAIVP